MDIRAERLIETIVNDLQTILGENLIGIYLHGSLAFGCFHWETGDIDIVVVTENEPGLEQKKAVIEKMMLYKAPLKGIEMSIVTGKHCAEFIYPTPYCLHWSEFHRDRYTADINGHIGTMNGTDKDLAAHFTVINHVGVTLCGKAKEDVFAPVPAECYFDSIKYDIENAVEDITENPVYMILNLCRAAAFVQEGKILSKADGAVWLADNMDEYRSLVADAAQCYRTGDSINATDTVLKNFAEAMLNRILK